MTEVAAMVYLPQPKHHHLHEVLQSQKSTWSSLIVLLSSVPCASYQPRTSLKSEW